MVFLRAGTGWPWIPVALLPATNTCSYRAVRRREHRPDSCRVPPGGGVAHITYRTADTTGDGFDRRFGVGAACAPTIVSTVDGVRSVVAQTVAWHPFGESGRALTCVDRFGRCSEDAGLVRTRTGSGQKRPCSDADGGQPWRVLRTSGWPWIPSRAGLAPLSVGGQTFTPPPRLSSGLPYPARGQRSCENWR
jgi:hypothetical protein